MRMMMYVMLNSVHKFSVMVLYQLCQYNKWIEYFYIEVYN